MAFSKKTWQNRVSEYANRRRLIDSSNNESVVTVQRYEGTVTQEGDAFNAANMNDLEDRIDTAISDAEAAAGTVRSVRVQATAPVTSSVNTAQTGTLNTTIALANGYGDTKNPYASKTKNRVLASPNGSDGVPSFRALAPNDFPTGHGDTTNPYGTKAANRVLAGPTSGNAAAPSFRALVAADIPSLGNISNAGAVNTAKNSLVNGDRFLISDSADGNKIKRGPAGFDPSITTTFLRRDGTWQPLPSTFDGINSARILVNIRSGALDWTATENAWMTVERASAYTGVYIDGVMIWGDTTGSWMVPSLVPIKKDQRVQIGGSETAAKIYAVK